MDNLTPEQRGRLMSRVKGRNTKPEILVRSLLHRLGYRFRIHRKDLPGTPDIVFPSRRKVIFVNGCFWHGHDCGKGRLPSTNTSFWAQKIHRNQQRDMQVIADLAEQNWDVLIIWQCEIKDLDTLRKKLQTFLELQSSPKNLS